MKGSDAMKKLSWAASISAAACVAVAQEVTPTWELGTNAFDRTMTTGKVEIVGGVVRLDGTSAFSIPKEALGAQTDYTIEFELRLPPNFKKMPRREGDILLLSNTDTNVHAGLSLRYCPPDYDLNGGVNNQFQITVNGYANGACGGLLGGEFTKFTVVAKDRGLMVFRNGMLWAMTGEVKPSSLPLTIGEILAKPLPAPYELRRFKLYDRALAPVGDDQGATMMRNTCGENYTMKRTDVKDRTLPRILVVGDSISGGYCGFITEHFKGRAYVDYWVGGSWFNWTVKGDDFPALRGWSGVLSNGPYDVVSWNAMTLHMWTPQQPGRCLVETYPGQMTRVIEHLRNIAPATRFIWVRCTPYTSPVAGKPSVIDEKKSERLVMFNKMTDAIMTQFGIPVVDLYGLCENNLDKASKDGVHWNGEASRLMADEIIKEIEKALPAKPVGMTPVQGKRP
jgi:hypothetical protein